MARPRLHPVLTHLRRLAGGNLLADLTDAQLVQRFAAARDEVAFAALLQRHAPLVWHVCRQVLGHEQDAEDAFQATFLVLARRAASLRRGRAIAGWLHRVAYRVAVRTGVERARRRDHERQAPAVRPAEPPAEAAGRELLGLLHEELNRLPERLRAPFVLCCLEGKSGAEAARQLGWKEGTVTGRLSEARKLLRRRLARRGVTLSAVAGLSGSAISAAPVVLVRATRHAAVPFATGQRSAAGLVSGSALALAEGVFRTGLAIRLTWVLLLVVLGLVGVGLAGRYLGEMNPPGDAETASGAVDPTPGAAPTRRVDRLLTPRRPGGGDPGATRHAGSPGHSEALVETAGSLPFHHEFFRPVTQRLHRLVVHADLLHDGDDLLAGVVERRLDTLLAPLRAAEVVAKLLVALQELILYFFHALGFRPHLLGQFLRDHHSPLQR